MSDSILERLDGLPSDNITVKTLKALDFIVPGEWENIVGVHQSIEAITGETDASRIQAIRSRMNDLYNDRSNGYQRAVGLYQTIDRVDAALGAAAIANTVGEKIGLLGFLTRLTPKTDTTQSLDLCLKIVTELIAYSSLNGLPVMDPGAFVAELQEHYTGPSLMRMAALVSLDGLLPLGPDFLQKVQDQLDGDGASAFANNPGYNAIASFIPRDNKVDFIAETFGAVQGWMDNLVGSVGLTPESVLDRVNRFIDCSDDALDVVAAFLDQTTNYYTHTGVQTVARKLILQAAATV